MFGHNTLLELMRGLQHVPGAEKQWDTSVSSAAIKAGICACLHCAKKETVSILQNAECFPAYGLPAGLSGQGRGHAYRHFYFPCHVFILESAQFSWESKSVQSKYYSSHMDRSWSLAHRSQKSRIQQKLWVILSTNLFNVIPDVKVPRVLIRSQSQQNMQLDDRIFTIGFGIQKINIKEFESLMSFLF